MSEPDPRPEAMLREVDFALDDDKDEGTLWAPSSELAEYVKRVSDLELRLAAAEQVCVLYGWTGSNDRSERGDAVTQAWMDWVHSYGHEMERAAVKDPAWDARIKDLARRRREIRDATIARLLEER